MTRNSTKFKFSEGERVLCFEPDPTKARVLYDAKILETQVKKDSKGKKAVEYLIHFQGWNSSWDRYVSESLILQDIQEHRLLQKQLADAARALLKENRKKKQRIGASLRGADPKFLTDSTDSSSAEDGDSCTHSSSEEDSTEHESNIELNDSQNSASNENICLTLNIPDQIKNILEEDVIKIKCRKKWIKLPCNLNVTTILDGFLRHFVSTLTSKHPEKTRASTRTNSTSSNTSSNAGDAASAVTQLGLCKEVIDGIRVSFDFLLATNLLYAEERPQLEQIKLRSNIGHTNRSIQSQSQQKEQGQIQDIFQWKILPDSTSSTSDSFLPCVVYGAIHLCRLIVKLPELIQKMHLTQEKRQLIIHFSELLLQYLVKQKNIVSEADYVTATKST